MHTFWIWFPFVTIGCLHEKLTFFRLDFVAVVPSLPVEEQHGCTDLEQGCGVQPEAIGAWLSDEGHGGWIIQCQQGIKSNIPKHACLSLWLSLVLM